jgi:hypothetical protein
VRRVLSFVPGLQNRRVGAWLASALLGMVAGAAALAQPALAWGSNYDDVISGVNVHIALPEQAMTAGYSWTMGPSVLHLTNGSGGHLYMTNKNTGAMIWSAGDYPGTNKVLIFQNDGNLVLYNQAGYPSWASNTWSGCDKSSDYPYWQKVLGLQQDGNFVVYCRHQKSNADYAYDPLWSTGTWCHSPGSYVCDP